VKVPIRHIGNTSALCDERVRANLRVDLEVERYRQLGVTERFRDEAPYRVCKRCIARVSEGSGWQIEKARVERKIAAMMAARHAAREKEEK
jgi:hypothetical protein